MKMLLKELGVSTVATLVLAVVLGVVYPAVVWMAGCLFPYRAGGSLIDEKGKLIGSELIGQNFTSDKYFTSRPSSAGTGYDATNSGGSNLGPLSQKLVDGVKTNVTAYRKQNGLDDRTPVPADAVTASASGLDPHISVQNALLQMARVARARGLKEEVVRRLVEEHTSGRDLGFLGEPRVNVLLLNADLDQYSSQTGR